MNLQPRARRLLYQLGLGHKKYRRFIILTRSRTGSNMLLSCLNSHPAIHIESEIFSRLNGRHAKSILNGIFCRHPRGIQAVGFKIFYYHPQDDESREVWDLLKRTPGLNVIHLTRRNVLRTLLSRKIAGERNIWSSHEEKVIHSSREKRTVFTGDELRAGFTQTKAWERDCERLFLGRPILSVVYEDFVREPELEYRRITDFLGVPYQAPRSDFRRQNPEPLHVLIGNYDELWHEFEDTEWADYFEKGSNTSGSQRRSV